MMVGVRIILPEWQRERRESQITYLWPFYANDD